MNFNGNWSLLSGLRWFVTAGLITSAQAADWSLERYSTDKGVIALQSSTKQSTEFVIGQAADVTMRNFLLLKANRFNGRDWRLRPSPFRAPWVLRDELGNHPQPVWVDQSPASPIGTDALVVRFHFTKGSAELSDQDKRELAQFGQSLWVHLQREPDFGLLIEGHTDSDQFVSNQNMDNQRLSELRAAVVAQAIARQLDAYADRLKSTGYADQRRIYVQNREDKKSSRRVEIKPFILEAGQ